MTVEDQVTHEHSTHEHLTHEHAGHDRAGAGHASADHIELPWYVLPDYRCFGCSPHNPSGVQLRFTHHGDGLRTVFRLGRAHESYPGVVHGGLLGVIADEIMGNLIVLRTGQIPFTTGMRVRYVLPVIVGGGYECVATVRAGKGPLLHTEAEIREEGGDLVATATASYQTVSLDEARGRISLDAPEVERLRQALSAAVAAATTSHPASPHPASTSVLAEESHVSVD
ncbi:PaaI family thioesterase [Pseudofrankia inefficax]|uniref:Thioesterase superfamily protein n=1 Tax=Pseudofrankia inefficax (strain DSM 45817 / CECT 9037 / DDB 130130 / EuI1c) TaxID=298654 RepID=E3J564_PSEI1|nr:PaaI family thioesterase [Pseudofrankia inefficax]ADP80662.1 thioesterase superfamily protein [Pseudofrankia inefficax]